MARKHYLHRLFEPGSVAVVGASDRVDAVGGRVLRNILDGGFAGAVYPVNSRRATVQGLQAYPRISAIGVALDLAVIAVPASDVPDVLRDAVGAGVATAIILSAGFGEQATDGLSKEPLVRIAREHGIKLLGPHTLGVLRPGWHFNASFARSAVGPGRVALLSQSVGFCNAMLDWAASNRFGLSLLASPGAAADLDFGELLDFCAVDADTRSILLYVERIADARAFVSGLRLAARVKPVVVLKSGGGAVNGAVNGASPDESPMADAAFDAAVRRAGAVRVSSVHELLTAARTLASGTKAALGQRLAIITNAAGPAAMAINRAHQHGLPMACPSESTREALSAVMPPGWQCANPVDLLGDAPAERYAEAAKLLLEDPAVDTLLALVTPQGVTDPLACAQALVAQANPAGKPVMACWMGQDLVADSRALLSAASIPQFSSPERAVDALAYLASYRNSQNLLLQLTPPLSRHAAPDLPRARTLVRDHIAAGVSTLPAAAVVELFDAMDARVLPVCGTKKDAPASFDRDIALMLAGAPAFGPVIYVGPAGSTLSRLAGVQASLPPLNNYLCRELLGRAVQRFAMEPLSSGQEAHLVDSLMTLSAIACELPEVAAISLPSLPLGEGAAPDATRITVKLRLRGDDAAVSHYGHMAILPYPGELENRVSLPGIEFLLIRPIRPEDADMEQRFFDGLSAQSRYYRFMYRLDHLSTAMLARFTQIDYDREMALVAVIDGGQPGERIVGVSRYAVNSDAVSCEFALAVSDEAQGRGIGSQLMEALFRIARNRGLTLMEGEVLAHNRKMLALCRSLGFTLRRCLDDPDIVAVTRPL
ncbi:MAG: GNAT family N-acetyltransferase [Chromatocurvus sp.]